MHSNQLFKSYLFQIFVHFQSVSNYCNITMLKNRAIKTFCKQGQKCKNFLFAFSDSLVACWTFLIYFQQTPCPTAKSDSYGEVSTKTVISQVFLLQFFFNECGWNMFLFCFTSWSGIVQISSGYIQVIYCPPRNCPTRNFCSGLQNLHTPFSATTKAYMGKGFSRCISWTRDFTPRQYRRNLFLEQFKFF